MTYTFHSDRTYLLIAKEDWESAEIGPVDTVVEVGDRVICFDVVAGSQLYVEVIGLNEQHRMATISKIT